MFKLTGNIKEDASKLFSMNNDTWKTPAQRGNFFEPPKPSKMYLGDADTNFQKILCGEIDGWQKFIKDLTGFDVKKCYVNCGDVTWFDENGKELIEFYYRNSYVRKESFIMFSGDKRKEYFIKE